MTSKTKKARIDVREKILCEATRLFGERGFDGVALYVAQGKPFDADRLAQCNSHS